MKRFAVATILGTVAPVWVAARRWAWRRSARMLSEAERSSLAGHYSESLLRRVRITEVDRIDLWAPLSRLGEHLAKRAGGVVVSPAGLALDDLIVVATVPAAKISRASLLFHEMVHVVQWAALGRRRFLREYLSSWAAAGWSYHDIPLEEMAYELQARFDAGERFDAEAEVRRRLGP